MNQMTIKGGAYVLTLLALSACATGGASTAPTGTVHNCRPPDTLTCDRFANEVHNCQCQKGDRLGEILDPYQ